MDGSDILHSSTSVYSHVTINCLSGPTSILCYKIQPTKWHNLWHWRLNIVTTANFLRSSHTDYKNLRLLSFYTTHTQNNSNWQAIDSEMLFPLLFVLINPEVKDNTYFSFIVKSVVILTAGFRMTSSFLFALYRDCNWTAPERPTTYNNIITTLVYGIVVLALLLFFDPSTSFPGKKNRWNIIIIFFTLVLHSQGWKKLCYAQKETR